MESQSASTMIRVGKSQHARDAWAAGPAFTAQVKQHLTRQGCKKRRSRGRPRRQSPLCPRAWAGRASQSSACAESVSCCIQEREPAQMRTAQLVLHFERSGRVLTDPEAPGHLVSTEQGGPMGRPSREPTSNHAPYPPVLGPGACQCRVQMGDLQRDSIHHCRQPLPTYSHHPLPKYLQYLQYLELQIQVAI
jgi:hypothetical protein